MKYATLEKPVGRSHDKLGKVTVENVEYPQLESLEELTQVCGNEKRALAWVNRMFRRESTNAGRNAIGAAKDDVELENLQNDVRSIVRNWTPAAQKVSKAELSNRVNTLAARLKAGEVLSNEELLEALAAAE